MNQTVQQIQYEAEHTRRHTRYRIPAHFECQGHRIKVHDWSASGLSLKQMPDELQMRKHLRGRMIFDFNKIETAIQVELEKSHENEHRSGYSFVNLERPQLATLHQIINAYLSGDIVVTGDIINVIKRYAFSPKGSAELLANQQSTWSKLWQKARRVAGLGLMVSLLAVLLALIGNGIYQRLFVVESLAAEIDGPIKVVRSMGPGVVQLDGFHPGDEVHPGQILATIKLRNGGGAVVESPCHCRLVTQHVVEGDFTAQGEPLFTLIPTRGNLFIDAKFDAKEAEKLTLGAPAQIRLSSGEIISGTLRSLRSGAALELDRAAPLKSVPIHPVMYLNAVIEPKQPLPLSLLGSAVFVRVDQFSTQWPN